MESNPKKRYSVNIAGVSLNLITEESAEFLTGIADRLSDEINAITNQSYCVAKIDAAILCALDAMGEADKAKVKISTLEAELSALRLEAENMRNELDRQDDSRAPSKPVPDNRTSEEKVKDLEKFLGERFSSIKE